MAKIVNVTSFIQDEVQEGEYLTTGTVEITLHGKTQRVRAYKMGQRLVAQDVAVKYPTGTKVWPGSVNHWLENGVEQIDGGFDNRATRSRVASIVGFYSEVKEAYRSQRPGTR